LKSLRGDKHTSRDFILQITVQQLNESFQALKGNYYIESFEVIFAKNHPMTKKQVQARNPEKYEYAYLLFMQGVAQNDICQRVEVSAPTLQSWKESGGWEAKRATRTISIDDLMQKTLKKISEILDKEGDDFSADAFAKAVNQLKALKSTQTVDDEIATFMAFQDYLIAERATYKEITDNFIKSVVKLQDSYIIKRKGYGKQRSTGN
jgi:hypothetical protein